ncbi:hypothetical protein BRYFOR_06740 [Marvinbryantia formatexigens DSM 14469]|uniref:Uncharacterized protein n=1 Tax=Marvinbryantia formatexigens DSM 14469 TaxID=478749 RepID=C6LDP2_9FIRM|nr:hypothetical protein BRYFOR_06740 [Marvinbryantia formatexigens DSM 14469]
MNGYHPDIKKFAKTNFFKNYKYFILCLLAVLKKRQYTIWE